jgi:quercetin dioxygenase-like cupin family protein
MRDDAARLTAMFNRFKEEHAMSHTQAFVTTPEQRPSPLDVVGIAVTVLAPNTRTGSYEITLQEGPEGVGPPPHSHPWDESFYVTSGSVLFSARGIDHMVGPGTLVHVPAGTVHAFRFGAGGGGMVEFSGAGGQATRLFSSVAEEVPEGAANLPKLLGVMQRHGVAVAA